ncbi:MAG: hypothetical protein WDO14_17350 [Bacteroidota bacterium]
MKSRILTLISICVVIVVSVAFTMPGKKQTKTAPVTAKTDASSQTTGGFAIDPKD